MVKKETVEKWGIDCIKFVLADDGTSVKMVYCSVCRDYYSEKIGGMRAAHGLKGAVSSLADKWILGTEVIKKSNAIDHVAKSVVHKVAVVAQKGSVTLSTASARGIVEVERQAAYMPENVVKTVRKITPTERAQLVKIFQLLHYLILQGKTFKDFEKFAIFEKDIHKVDLGSEYLTTRSARSMCHILAQNIKLDEVTKPMNNAKCHYFSLMYDASVSAKTKEEKEVYVIKTCKAGKPKFQVMSVEEPDEPTAHCLKKSLEQSIQKQNFVFDRKDHQVGNGSDGSSVNDELFCLEREELGEHLIKGWCANHTSELGIHDAFKHGELNKVSENLTCNVFCLFKKSKMKWRLFKHQSQSMNLKCLKYKRGSDSQWVKNQLHSLNNYLTNLPIFLAFLHQQIQSPCNPKLKDAKHILEGHLKAASCLELVLYMTVKQDLLDYLSPFSQLLGRKLLLAPETLSSLKSALQVIMRIKHILDDQGSAGLYTEGLFPTLASLVLPNLVSTSDSLPVNGTKTDEMSSADLQTFHGYTMTTGLNKAINMVFEEILEVLGYLEVNLTAKFSEFMDSSIYHSAAVFLDTKSYQYNSVDVIFESAVMLQEQFCSLLEANFCEVEKLRQEFSFLYTHVTTFLSRSTNEQAWQQLFASQRALSISNILHIAEICIVLPTSSADLERIFHGFSRIVANSCPPLKNDIENELIVSSTDFDNFHPGKYDNVVDEFLLQDSDEKNQPTVPQPSPYVKQKRPYKRRLPFPDSSPPFPKKDQIFVPNKIKKEMQSVTQSSPALMNVMTTVFPQSSHARHMELNLDDSSFDSTGISSDSEDDM